MCDFMPLPPVTLPRAQASRPRAVDLGRHRSLDADELCIAGRLDALQRQALGCPLALGRVVQVRAFEVHPRPVGLPVLVPRGDSGPPAGGVAAPLDGAACGPAHGLVLAASHSQDMRQTSLSGSVRTPVWAPLRMMS